MCLEKDTTRKGLNFLLCDSLNIGKQYFLGKQIVAASIFFNQTVYDKRKIKFSFSFWGANSASEYSRRGQVNVLRNIQTCVSPPILSILERDFYFCTVGEGDAYGASLRQISARPRAVVTLRASTCVDCHVIKLKDLADVMRSYPNLRAQLLAMMDSADQNDLYDEVV